MKRGLGQYLDDLNFIDDLNAILNGEGTPDGDVISTFVAQQMGSFLEIMVPAFTQVRYWGFVVRPIVKKFNKRFKWIATTQDIIEYAINALFHVVKNFPGMDIGLQFLCPQCAEGEAPTLRDFFEDNKDDVAFKFAQRYHMHK